MTSIFDFRKHPLLGEFCVTPSDMVVRRCDADGKETRKVRVGSAGCMAMLKPDPEVNPRRDAAWFGVLTWVQPEDEVRRKQARMCEIWWVYSRQHVLDVVLAGNAPNKKELLEDIRKLDKKQAWISNHFSDEPLDSILTIPRYGEIKNRIRLSSTRYLDVDAENEVYEFVEYTA